MSYTYIHPRAFVDLLEQWTPEQGKIIDVREPFEWEYYHLEESRLMPMNSIPGRLDELDKEDTLYVICAHGVRSETVSHFLAEQGYAKVVNVNGGMAAVGELKGFAYD